MTGKLVSAVGRRSQFLTAWASTGLLECLHDMAAGFPQREKSRLIMGHMKYVSNLSNDPCLSVCSCCRQNTYDCQSIRFRYTGPTLSNGSKNIQLPKKVKKIPENCDDG